MTAPKSAVGPGSLVAVDHAGQRVLALVRGSARGLAEVVTESGAPLKLSVGKIASNPGFTTRSPDNTTECARIIRELRDRVDESQQDLDLETIWEIVASDQKTPMTVSDIATMWFGDTEAAGYFAIEEALRKDTLYFKLRKGRYEARTSAEVEAVSRQLEGEARRLATRERFIDILLNESFGTAAQRAEALHSDPELRTLVELLHDFAAFGESYDRRVDAMRLLEAVDESAVDRTVRATAETAFDLLLQLGLVERHENLALRRYHIRDRFDAELGAFADEVAKAPPATVDDLEDLTSLDVITIDDAETLDMDDAIHCRPLGDGMRELGVHITDVAAIVTPEDPLDLEARRRGSSVYLPTGVIPMLPSSLSEGRLSLIIGRERAALSYLFEVDALDRVISRRLVASRIVVKERLTYDEADAILDSPDHPHHEMLSTLNEFAASQRHRRALAGSVDIDLPDVRVRVVDDEIAVHRLDKSQSRLLVSELMVLAGETAAQTCMSEQIPAVYRTQEQVVDDDEWARASDIRDPLTRQFALVRLLKRGELRCEPGLHFGLGLDAYSQSTSPIRRYADLIVNYQLRQHLTNRPLVFGNDEMVALAARAEIASQHAANAQRDSDRYWRMEYLRRSAPESVEALVLDYESRSNRRNIPIVLPDLMLRTNFPGRGLEVGQRINVRPTRVDPRRDLLQVDLVR